MNIFNTEAIIFMTEQIIFEQLFLKLWNYCLITAQNEEIIKNISRPSTIPNIENHMNGKDFSQKTWRWQLES